MPGSTLEKKDTKCVSQSNDFETFLQTRRENTTYNGIELETENWHQELFGFKKKINK
ncbi:MAG: hypothetical protein K6C94_04755 [Candidatus Gastranaerophilales bacterium]|nr:hypothetical protein [Candidatus Gastranaerophilales bacterium]